MRIIAKKTLRLFCEKHTNCEHPLKTWYEEAMKADWSTPKDIKVNYTGARFIAGNRVVFNIKGNSYRLIVKINYNYKMVWIRFVGTHAE